MRLAIDYVSLAIFIVAYVFAQIRAVPIQARYGVLSLAMAAIAAYRMRLGVTGGLNLALVGVAVAVAIFYAYKAIAAKRR